MLGRNDIRKPEDHLARVNARTKGGTAARLVYPTAVY